MKRFNSNARAIEVGKSSWVIEKLKERFAEVGDVRGIGAMNSIEFVKRDLLIRPDGNCVKQ